VVVCYIENLCHDGKSLNQIPIPYFLKSTTSKYKLFF